MKLKLKQMEQESKRWLLQKSCQRQRHLNKVHILNYIYLYLKTFSSVDFNHDERTSVYFPLDLSQKGELRAIVQKEVKEEVMRLTAHLEKCLQESTVQLNTALTALETRLQPKK